MSTRVRCAIYTRKSTEEGLEQDFNSLDAQREACEAFVKSQRGLGWTALSTRYDDGGISGGTLDRPALQDLLRDIDLGKVDLVVVYKVDRLTRSLSDFAKIVERFEARGISFVSVTQQFNTSTSMGRLTLNVLLSFAQFEREVTGERIRDKIAASRQKGMWMGGTVPLGYDLKDRKLLINAHEAAAVRTLFGRYLELGSVRALVNEAHQNGIHTKVRQVPDGAKSGGQAFTRGHLYYLLSNPLYAGDVRHKGKLYRGEHDAIVDRETFEAVQTRLAANTASRTGKTNAAGTHLLTGLIYDEAGERLCPTHASKKGKRYRYYISKHLMHGTGEDRDGWRLPAAELERVIIQALRDYLRDERRIVEDLCLERLSPSRMQGVLKRTSELADKAEDPTLLQRLVTRISVAPTVIDVALERSELLTVTQVNTAVNGSSQAQVIGLSIPIRLQRRGVEAKLVIGNANLPRAYRDANLIVAIARARAWWQHLVTAAKSSIATIAAAEKMHASDVGRMLPLAFLAPDIVEAILAGRQPVSLTAKRLKRIGELPYGWEAQRQMLGFDAVNRP